MLVSRNRPARTINNFSLKVLTLIIDAISGCNGWNRTSAGAQKWPDLN